MSNRLLSSSSNLAWLLQLLFAHAVPKITMQRHRASTMPYESSVRDVPAVDAVSCKLCLSATIRHSYKQDIHLMLGMCNYMVRMLSPW